MASEQSADKASVLRDHLPLVVSVIIAGNFVLHLLTLAKGNISIASALIQADPVRVGFQSLIFLVPSLITVASLWLAVDIAAAHGNQSYRSAEYIALITLALLGVQLQGRILFIETMIQVLIVMLTGWHSRGKINLLLPRTRRNYTSFEHEIQVVRTHTMRAETRHLKRQRRLAKVISATVKPINKVMSWLNNSEMPTFRARIWLRLRLRGVWLRVALRTGKLFSKYDRLVKAGNEKEARLLSLNEDLLDLRRLQLRRSFMQPPSEDELRHISISSNVVASFRRDRSRLILLNLILLVVLSLFSTSILPLERISTTSGPVIGYVVARDVSQTVILRKSPRDVVFLKTMNVQSRILCSDDTSWESWLDQPVIPGPTLPRC